MRELPKDYPYEFKLVHQGGHHNVYCNTLIHIQTPGGFTKLTLPNKVVDTYRCDCINYK